MKLGFHLGSVEITVIDTSAMGHEDDIYDLFDEYGDLMKSPPGTPAQDAPICQRLGEIREELAGYGYRYDNITGRFY
jgi:hypothetical protein